MAKDRVKLTPTRRRFLAAAGGATVLATAPAFMRSARGAARPIKIGAFMALTGPASLFGPTQKACTELAVEQINKAGGLLGRRVEAVIVDGGVAPAEAAKTAVRLLLNDKVDFIIGSHDSAVREALVATIKGRVPYVYTPIYEGGECAKNTYVIADTPQQQMDTALPWLHEKFKMKDAYLVGNDYVWPHTVNTHAKGTLKKLGVSVAGEEYVPLGAPNKFEEIVTRIKAKNPQFVISTLVGADNINFNRTFVGFGLDKSIVRMASLLEENTLAGIGKENAGQLFGAMSYYASIDTPLNKAFKEAYAAKYGEKAPPLSLIGEDCYAGVKFVAAVVAKARSTRTANVAKAAVELGFDAPGGHWTMRANRHVDKTMHLADATGGEFKIVKSWENVASGQTCS